MYRTRSSISSLKLTLGLMLALALSSCGFTPVYARTDSNLISPLASIRVAEIDGRAGQILRYKLTDLLNPGFADVPVEYELQINLEQEMRELGIKGDLRVTRYDILFAAKYKLISLASGKVEHEGIARLKSSYNRTESEFSTFVAEEDAREKAAEELAEDIKSRLVADFAK